MDDTTTPAPLRTLREITRRNVEAGGAIVEQPATHVLAEHYRDGYLLGSYVNRTRAVNERRREAAAYREYARKVSDRRSRAYSLGFARGAERAAS